MRIISITMERMDKYSRPSVDIKDPMRLTIKMEEDRKDAITAEAMIFNAADMLVRGITDNQKVALETGAPFPDGENVA